MKAIIALDSEELIKKVQNENNIEIVFKNLQYREAILEFLEKNKNTEGIFISENLPGEISIESLIKKIRIINKKIKIIFFLEKENIEKEKELNKLGVKNIYIKNNIDLKKLKNKNIINKKIENKESIKNINNKKIKNKNNKKIINNELIKNKILENKNIKNNKTKNKKLIKNKKIKNKNINNKKTKIITIQGKCKTGKTTIVNLMTHYLIKKNEKVMPINLNKKTEKYCLGKLHNKFSKIYDYILIEINDNCEENIRNNIIQKSYKKLIIIDQNFLGIKGIKDILKNDEKSLHIIYNKYHLGGISDILIRKIMGKKVPIYNVSYNQKYKILGNNYYKNFEFKIDKKTKREFEKIFYKK